MQEGGAYQVPPGKVGSIMTRMLRVVFWDNSLRRPKITGTGKRFQVTVKGFGILLQT